MTPSGIRPAKEADCGALLAVLADAFRLTPGGAAWESKRSALQANPAEWLVLEESGRIVGGLRIRRDRLRMGEGTILKGDVGEVCVSPERQGQGVGSQLLSAAVTWMQDHNFGLSRLGGSAVFYSRFGYLRFPRPYLEILVGRRVEIGARHVIEGTMPIPEDQCRRIRPYDPERDTGAVQALCRRFEAPYAHLPVLDGPEPVPPTGPLSLIYEDGDALLGFIVASIRGEDRNAFEGPVSIDRLAYDRDTPAALSALLARVYNEAFDRGLSRITARLPTDPLTLRHLAASPLHFQVCETWGGAASNMLQVISLRALLKGLIPEFRARLARIPACRVAARLRLDIGKDAATLTCENGRVDVAAPTPGETVVHIAELDFMRMLLGMLSADEWLATVPDMSPRDTACDHILRKLFPRCITLPGSCG